MILDRDLPEAMLDSLLHPRAVTIVGASPNGLVTEHLLRNLKNRSCRFDGPVHLVNPGYRKLFDVACVPSAADVQGSPGLVYLLVPAPSCITALQALRDRPDGVVLFPDASGAKDGYEAAVAAWGRTHGVAVLGPQSNGLVSPAGRLNGLLIPIVDEIRPGGVAVLAQSGGVLGGLVKFLAQRHIGLHSALEYGTSCMLTPWTLGERLAGNPDVRLLALYADGLDSIDALSRLARVARVADKPLVIMVAGTSAAARRAIGSHSGMAATPRRILEGVAAQHGAVLVRDLDELVWSIEALAGVNFKRPPAGRVALFSDSGGGGIAMAEALEANGVPLVPPGEPARTAVERRFGDALNPFDFGSASMGQVREQAADVRAVGADSSYGIFAFASTIGTAVREQSVHVKQLDEFAVTVDGMGQVPFIASPIPFLEEDGSVMPGRAVLGNGSKESAAKLRALTTWAHVPMAVPTERMAAPHAEVALSGTAAQELLKQLPLRWPEQVTISSIAALELGRLRFPVVVKTEAGLAHRAQQGGVLPGITREAELVSAVTYLLERFGGPVSITQLVEHDIEYFLGAQRAEDSVLVLLGAGGDRAEDAHIRLAPMNAEQAEQFALERTPAHAIEFASLLLAFQDWLMRSDWVEAVDLNPIVPVPQGLMALDAKIHRR